MLFWTWLYFVVIFKIDRIPIRLIRFFPDLTWKWHQGKRKSSSVQHLLRLKIHQGPSDYFFNRCYSISVVLPWHSSELDQHNCPPRVTENLNVSINVLWGREDICEQRGLPPPDIYSHYSSPHFSPSHTIVIPPWPFDCLCVYKVRYRSLNFHVVAMCGPAHAHRSVWGRVCVRTVVVVCVTPYLGWLSHHLRLWVSVWPFRSPLDEALKGLTNHGGPTLWRLNQPPWAAKWSHKIHLTHAHTCGLRVLWGLLGSFWDTCPNFKRCFNNTEFNFLQRSYREYFGFISLRLEELETRCPSFM